MQKKFFIALISPCLVYLVYIFCEPMSKNIWNWTSEGRFCFLLTSVVVYVGIQIYLDSKKPTNFKSSGY